MRSLFSRFSTLRKKIAPRVLVIFAVVAIPSIAYMVELLWTLNIVDSGFTSAKMYIVDVDGDNDKDIVGIAQTPDDVAWYENDGSENFTKHTIDSNAPGVRDVQVGDVDNDGDIDIVIAQVDSTPDGVYWYDNDGSENFTKRTISTVTNPINIALVDINDDDELDVLASLYSDGDIIYYENQGGTPSTFVGTTIDATLTNPLDVVAADIDGDNDVDIIGSHASTTIPWYENDGSESFTKRTFSTATASVPREILIIDVDGDTKLDMLISNSSSLELFISDGNDNPTFSKSTIDNSASIDHFDAADFDGDTDIDIVGANEGSSKALVWLENDGSENFTNYDIDTDITYAWLIDAGDIDGDSDTDFVAGSNNGVELWINGGDASASSSSGNGGWAQANQRRKMYKQWRAGEYVYEDVEAPTLTAVGIFDPVEQERLRAAAGSGASVDDQDKQDGDASEDTTSSLDSQVGTKVAERLARLHHRMQMLMDNESLPTEIITTGQETEESYESAQHERVCLRVENRFSGNVTMIDRINLRLEKRFGWQCSVQ